MYAIRSMTYLPRARERLTVRVFRDSSAMHRFLNTGSNALRWREVFPGEPAKAGTYAYVGRVWRNVRDLDSMILNHV